ncbi:hypothetical protein DL765_001240 [Monosporascus sp. GIB2]|nr:hypothetical protein DL765_001240 [Monosporascus sp. GIB2]
MSLAYDVLYFALHPNHLGMVIQWKLRRGPIHERDENHESATAKVCFELLDETGRSFSSVVKELHPELLLPVCVFYLILRGLDTIEDDTSMPLETKEPLLRDFKDYLEQDSWTFTGNRPEEKDRQLLVQFDNVIAEFRNLKPVYQAIIKDITDEMGNGMADFARNAAFGDAGVNTVEEYDLYCWYVASIVNKGLTHLFIKAKLENLELALSCSFEMVLNALGHASDCLSYLVGLREQSVFNFCAIPQSMAMATLELCFRNPAVFEGNIKSTKGDAFQLMVESSQDLERVCKVFRRYIHRIQQKNDPKDPNFLKISIACEQIERFAEAQAPQSVELAKSKTRGRLWSPVRGEFSIRPGSMQEFGPLLDKQELKGWKLAPNSYFAG